MEAMAQRMKMESGHFWDVLFRKVPAPPGWAAAWSDAFAAESLPSTLTRRLQSVKVNRVTEEHKFNIARGQKRGDKFLQKITASKYTQTSLAAALGITPALMSMYRRADDPRPIPRERAEKIEALTGWKATARNWPGGIVS